MEPHLHCEHAFEVWCLINHKNTHYLYSVSSYHFYNFLLCFLNLLYFLLYFFIPLVASFFVLFFLTPILSQVRVTLSELWISSWLRTLDVRRKYGHLIPGLSRHKIEADVGLQIETVTLTWLRCCSCRVRDRLPPPPLLCNWGTVRHADIAYVISGFVSAISNLQLWRVEHPPWWAFPDIGGRLHSLPCFLHYSFFLHITRAFLLLTRIGRHTAHYVTSCSACVLKWNLYVW
jgi:hypothetical protein